MYHGVMCIFLLHYFRLNLCIKQLYILYIHTYMYIIFKFWLFLLYHAMFLNKGVFSNI